MKRNISHIEKCANCGCCSNICPVQAIHIEANGLFYKPVVVESLCVACGKCLKACPLENDMPDSQVQEAYWGWHKDPKVVKGSSSGGAFTALADVVLSQGGVIFGACYDEQNQVRICSTDEVPLESLRKSKYVESLVGNSFTEAREQLDMGRLVLFCGTPCQIAGLKQYLGREYENLYTCDFSCGGLSSHKLYQQHLAALQTRFGAPVASIDFRPKTFGWSVHGIKVRFQNGKQYSQTAILDPYFFSFAYEPLNKREYCFDCKFAQQHAADIVLADFWKYRQLIGKRAPETGMSLILLCSEKGVKLVTQLSEQMQLTPIDREQAAYNLCTRHSTPEQMKRRDHFLALCEEQGIQAAAKAIGMPTGFYAVWIQCKHILKGALLRFL